MPAMAGEDKAVVLLTSLSPALAEAVLARLKPDLSGRLRGKLKRPGTNQPPETVEQIMAEVKGLIGPSNGGDATILPLPPPAERSASSAQRATAPPAPKATVPPPDLDAFGDPVSALRDLPVPQLATALTGEQGRTVALVLDCLEATPAGEVLKRLPAELRREASMHLGRAPNVSLPLLQRVARALMQKCRAANAGPTPQNGNARIQKLADMLRLLPKADRMEVLAAMEQHDGATAALIKDLLYTFDDLLNIEDRSIQKLLADIDSKALATALKGASQEIMEKVSANLSKRAKERLQEEMELLGFVSAAQVAQAQQTVVAAIQRLDAAGELIMKE